MKMNNKKKKSDSEIILLIIFFLLFIHSINQSIIMIHDLDAIVIDDDDGDNDVSLFNVSYVLLRFK